MVAKIPFAPPTAIAHDFKWKPHPLYSEGGDVSTIRLMSELLQCVAKAVEQGNVPTSLPSVYVIALTLCSGCVLFI